MVEGISLFLKQKGNIMANQTARDLIKLAYTVSGVYNSVDSIPQEDSELALNELNGLIDTLRNDELYIPSESVFTFNTEANKLSYTIGIPSGLTPPDWSINQEIVRLDSMRVLIGNTWSVLSELSNSDYYRASQNIMAQTIPTTFSYNKTRNPYDVISFLNPPSSQWQVQIATQGIVPNYTLDDEISLPSGYFGVLEYGLATLLADIAGLDSSRVASTYGSRLSRLKRTNSQEVPKLKRSSGGGIYSVGSDSVLYSNGGF